MGDPWMYATIVVFGLWVATMELLRRSLNINDALLGCLPSDDDEEEVER